MKIDKRALIGIGATVVVVTLSALMFLAVNQIQQGQQTPDQNQTEDTVDVTVGELRINFSDPGWAIFAQDPDNPLPNMEDMGNGVYRLETEDICETPEWENHETCMYFENSYQVPLINETSQSGIVISYLENSDTTKVSEFTEIYKQEISSIDDLACIGGVLKDNTTMINIAGQAPGSEDLAYKLLDQFNSGDKYELVMDCREV